MRAALVRFRDGHVIADERQHAADADAPLLAPLAGGRPRRRSQHEASAKPSAPPCRPSPPMPCAALLTMLGIVIGVAAVIAMVAIGSGARNLVDRQIKIARRQPRHHHAGQRHAGRRAARRRRCLDAHRRGCPRHPAARSTASWRRPLRARRRPGGRWRQQLGHQHLCRRPRLFRPRANGTWTTAGCSTRRRSAAARSSPSSAARWRSNLFGDDRPGGARRSASATCRSASSA